METTRPALTRHRPADRLLRRTLAANALVSATWGLAVAVGAPWIAPLVGVPTAATVAVGTATVGVAVLFHAFSRRPVLRRGEGLLAAVGDTVFGAALVVLALTLPDATDVGRWLVGLSGAVVLDLAALEIVGLRRLSARRAARGGTTARQPAVAASRSPQRGQNLAS